MKTYSMLVTYELTVKVKADNETEAREKALEHAVATLVNGSAPVNESAEVEWVDDEDTEGDDDE